MDLSEYGLVWACGIPYGLVEPHVGLRGLSDPTWAGITPYGVVPAARAVGPTISAYEVPRDANAKTWPPATTPIRPPTQTMENPLFKISVLALE